MQGGTQKSRHWLALFFGVVASFSLMLISGSSWWAVLLAAIIAVIVTLLIVKSFLPGEAATKEEVRHSAQPLITPFVDALLDLVDHPIVILDARRRVEAANQSAMQLLGEHIIGVDVRIAFRNPTAAALLFKEECSGTRIELPDLGGADQNWEMLVDPLEDRQIVRLVDRTALRTTERIRVDFVANASHELRTPLATLIGFIETMEGPAADDDEARQRFLGIMHGEARRMLRLVNDLMSLSRIEANKHRAPTQAIALAPLVDEVRASLGHGFESSGRDFVVDTDEGLWDVSGDRDQLLQLLHNLINNAIKYGLPETAVTVRIRNDGQTMVRLVVEDEGEGIAPEHLPRLTERFYRVDAGRSRSVGGTGLGLSIVKHIVERHRGQLLIDSVVGRGTRMTVLLPRHQGFIARDPLS